MAEKIENAQYDNFKKRKKKEKMHTKVHYCELSKHQGFKKKILNAYKEE